MPGETTVTDGAGGSSVESASRQWDPASTSERLRDDAWALVYTNQNAVLAPMLAAAEAGIAAAEHDSLAGQRLTQMRDFYAFLRGEIPTLLDRWHQRSPSD